MMSYMADYTPPSEWELIHTCDNDCLLCPHTCIFDEECWSIDQEIGELEVEMNVRFNWWGDDGGELNVDKQVLLRKLMALKGKRIERSVR